MRVHAGDASAPPVQIAHEIAREVRRGVDLHVHHRFEDRRTRARHRVLERERARELERQLVRVHIVVGTVEHRDAKIDHRVSSQVATRPRVLYAFLDGRDELARDRAAEDVVHELEVGAALQRLHANLAVSELTVAAGLLLVTSVRFGRCLDRLAVGNARRLQVHVHAEAALELGDGDLDVQLALP